MHHLLRNPDLLIRGYALESLSLCSVAACNQPRREALSGLHILALVLALVAVRTHTQACAISFRL